VLVFVSHARRELVHLNVTANPTAAWVWRQLIAATPWGRAPRYLVRDRDAVYGRDFVPRARRLGIEPLLTPIRAPRAKDYATDCTSSVGLVATLGAGPRPNLRWCLTGASGPGGS